MRAPELYQIYAISFVAVFLGTLINSAFPWKRVSLWLNVPRNIARRHLVGRYAFLGPWSIRSFSAHVLFIGINSVCVCFTWQHGEPGAKRLVAASLDVAASQAGYLAMANLFPIYLVSSLPSLSDLFNTSLRTYTRIHRAVGAMAICLSVFHAAVHFADQPSFKFSDTSDITKLLMMASVLLLCLASTTKHFAYELFLQAHQFFAILLIVSIFWHILTVSYYNRLPVFIYCIMVGVFSSFYAVRVIYRNKTLGNPWPSASLTGLPDVEGVVHLRLQTFRQLTLRPGQYLILWIPRVQFWSGHPFTIAASTWHPMRKGDTGEMKLDFYIQARGGFTRKLLQSCHENRAVKRFAIFSGPHGTPIRHNSANTVILIATGMGIWPIFSYIEDLIRTSRNNSATSRIILLYMTKKLPTMVRDAINVQLCKGDERMRIFIYDESEYKVKQLGRTTILPEAPDLRLIVERPGDFEKEMRFKLLDKSCIMGDSDQDTRGGHTLVLVSAENSVRDKLANIVASSRKRLELHELDFVPQMPPPTSDSSPCGISEIEIARETIGVGRSSEETLVANEN